MTRRTRQPRTSRTSHSGGFTLVELILVLLVLTIVVGMAVPSVSGFLGWSRSRDAVSQIVALAQYAKSKAAADAKSYKLTANGTSCWLEVQQGEAFQRVTDDDLAEEIGLPDGASVEFVPGKNGSGSVAAVNAASTDVAAQGANDGVIFYPDGRTSAGVIRYTTPTGIPILFASPSPAESFRAMTAQEAQRL
jgi:Tfp pilus assembly protein FimT